MTIIDLPTSPRSGCHASTILFEAPYKPSKPIEIPTRRRHGFPPALSPVNRPLSPELIFEMSPINSSSTDSFFSSDYHAHYSSFVHRSYKYRTAESASASKSPPFMYPFPRPSAHYRHNRPIKPDRLVVSQSPESFPSSAIPLFCSTNKSETQPSQHSIDDSPLQHHCLTSAFEDDLENSSECQSQACTSSASTSSRGRSRHRSSVYDRAVALASPESIYVRPRGRALVSRSQLSPPPLLPQGGGRKSCFEGLSSKDDVGPALEEVNMFDIGFGKHLMRRTEDEKRVRVGRASVVSSVQGSFGG